MIKQILSRYIHTHWLQASPTELTQDKIAAFESIYQAALNGPGNTVIDYDGAYPKHEFLSYLVEHKDILLHGSYTWDIDVLKPIRKSTDRRRCGSLNGVYACSDGIWPIFFAVLDRTNRAGLISNGCYWIEGEGGLAKKFYYFAIDSEWLESMPWREGTIYIVPRQGFERLRDPAGFLLEEWLNSEVVQPLARLQVLPGDFPFLKEVRGYNRGNWQELQKRVAGDPPGKLFDVYTGKYEVDKGFILTVVKDQKNLFIQAGGFPAVEVYPESESSFTLGTARISFPKDEQGAVTELVISLLGQNTQARKIA